MEKFKHSLIAFIGVLTLIVAFALSADAQQFSDFSAPVNLGSTVNTASTDGCPFISKDGLSLYFASNRPGALGGLDLYVSERASADAPWGAPKNLGPTINSGNADFCPTLTLDGHFLYFVSDRSGGVGGEDIYVSFRRNKRDNFAWEAPVNLSSEINTTANDVTPSYFEDDRTGIVTLYFHSNRTGGPGGTDIYASTMRADGTFGPPTPVEELNTSFNDQRPNIRSDGLEIFFESNRTGSAGPADLWVSTRASTADRWSTPVNLGTVVNSPSSEGRPSISFDGTTLYFMSDRPGGFGGNDLYVTTRTKLREECSAPYIVTAGQSTVSPGSSINVSWIAPSGRAATDWIGVYAVGASDAEGSILAWQYTGGAVSGRVTFTAPWRAGQYEFRYFLEDGFRRAATSSVVTVR